MNPHRYEVSPSKADEPKPESRVLFDEDYRTFIWRLMELLDKERAEVKELREALEVAKAVV